jgi:hypothetical protein
VIQSKLGPTRAELLEASGRILNWLMGNSLSENSNDVDGGAWYFSLIDLMKQKATSFLNSCKLF